MSFIGNIKGRLLSLLGSGSKIFLGFVFLGTFIVGSLFFFPVHAIESTLNDTLSKATRQDVQVTGSKLGNGLLSGGLVSYKATKLELFMPRSGALLTCYNVEVTPSVLALFLLKLQVHVQCHLDPDGASELSTIASAPIWSPQEMNLSIGLNGVQLTLLASAFNQKGWKGVLDGEVVVNGLQSGLPGMIVDWELSGSGLGLPASKNYVMSLPALNLDRLRTTGSFQSSKLTLSNFELGVRGSTPFWTDLEADLGLNRALMPVSGQLKGKLKTDPQFESQYLKALNMDLAFGSIKASGNREFTKEVKGNPVSLLMSPPIE